MLLCNGVCSLINKLKKRPCTNAYGVLHRLTWVWLAEVVWSCVMSGVHCVKFTVHTVHTAHDAAPHNHRQPQPTQPVQNTICGSTRSYSPDDGHNDVRNMLR